MIQPTLEQAKTLSEGNNFIPIAMQMYSDIKTSIELLKNIRKESDNWYILESVSGSSNWSRYTFLGYNPSMSIYGTGGSITIKNGREKTVENGNPVEILKNILSQYKSPRIPSLPPFTGGFVGYLSYDFCQNFIPGLKLNAKDEEGFKDFHLMLMDKVIAFDNFKQTIYLIVNVPTENLEQSYIKGVTDLKDMERLVLEHHEINESKSYLSGDFTPLFTEREYAKMVDKVKSHIVEGDIFQAVLSNRFKAPFKNDLMQAYRYLRRTNPSPYMVYMKLGDTEIACSSPETLVSLRDGGVSSFPLAGTCPRADSDEDNVRLERELLKNEKELAEHDMLVDLARNDVGRVCEFGSVKVEEYREIKRFSNVSHIGSRVTGTLRDGLNAIDVIASALPAGTLSGAPKKRACEIIDEIECVKRGIYGGAIGYIDFAGNMDMCIGIRMAVLKDGFVYVQSGAGIVADSIPENEYRETLNKAKAIMNALKHSGEE